MTLDSQSFDDTLTQATLLLREQKHALLTNNLEALDNSTQQLHRVWTGLEQSVLSRQNQRESLPASLQDQVQQIVQLAQDNQKTLLAAYQRVSQTLNLIQLAPYQPKNNASLPASTITRDLQA